MTMQGAVGVDQFATKGVEYLLVIGFLVALVLFWRFLNPPGRSAPRESYAVARGPSARRWFHVPEEVYFHPGHSWVLDEGGQVVRIGVDDFAQKLLGVPSNLRLPEVGTHLEQGNPGWSAEVDAEDFDFLSPVDGVVIARNEAALRLPDLVNNDPYGEGWLLEVKASKMRPNLKSLLRGDTADAWMGATEAALFQHVPSQLGMVMQDGGIPVTGIARALSQEKWDEIAREFLLTADR
jgi:glycine cleavage system H lipoate-binding protein